MTKICKEINELQKIGIFKLLKLGVTRTAVCKVLKCIEETAAHFPRVRSTSKHLVRTPQLINIREKIRRDSGTSIRKLISKASVSCETMENVFKKDLKQECLICAHIVVHLRFLCEPQLTPIFELYF